MRINDHPNQTMYSPPFIWHTLDVSRLISATVGSSWSSQVIEFARSQVKTVNLRSNSVTSREVSDDVELSISIVDGVKIRSGLPWLYSLYHGLFLSFAELSTGKRLMTAKNDLYGVNVNVQFGSSTRYECHIDSNPVQGMLYVTSHSEFDGGELVVANRPGVFGVSTVNEDCVRIYPRVGRMIFFDARNHSHYVSPLLDPAAARYAIAMNFYSEDCPEDMRPADLNSHLGLE